MLTWDARWFAICSIGAWMLVVGFLVTIMSVFGMKLPVWMGFVLAVCLFGGVPTVILSAVFTGLVTVDD